MTHTKTATDETSLIRFWRWWRKRGRHAEGHRPKAGKEGADDDPVLGAAKRPMELQIATHFEDRVSRTSQRHFLNNEVVANIPKRPCKYPNAQPSNMAVAWGGGMDLRE